MHIEQQIKEKFEGFYKRQKKNMADALGLEFEYVSRDEMRASMPVDENTTQPMGILHGGASVALAETLASVGGYLNLKNENKIVVGLEINANHVRPVSEGNKVVGISKPIHRGSQTQVWETRIKNESGKLVCISRCTLAVVNKRK
ncbi:hotdog fold thioesterase [Rhodohalobacter sulfatireducens]|uniref:Hotdog fold thioesterase n=1 Tax=Rhodohalobacter sulfatireducens TaxID=2911366 RepID=A0ABS9KDJ3_9BACT|nr:hotdog fold thioesterase [Rhodohalobacter sulfatireducens]MCG2588906.1 hotdog fold thioesterase [Rhodohalobacter sulfatireducens]